MKMTEALKAWLIDNCDVEKDASDDEFRKAAGFAIATGALSMDKFAELTADEAEKEADEFSKKLDSIADGIGKLTEVLTTKAAEPAPKEEKAKDISELKRQMKDAEPEVRVKGAWEQYGTTKSAMVFPMFTKSGRPHPHAGKPVSDFAEKGRVMEDPSELDQAISGAFCKFLIATAQKGGSKTFGFQSLPEHDKELLRYGLENSKWVGSSDGSDYSDIVNRQLTPGEQKALIDDATSGGIEAAPIVFDDAVIQAPLLNGELYPLVNTVPLDRGRRVEGVATGTVTGAWGGIDDTAISLFNTASYVSAFDTTIYRWQGAIHIGLDFMSDTPIDFAAHVTAQYGERLMEDLDDVIAAGNGTTQPEGIMTKSGTTSVNFGATTSLGNYESLRFGVAKQEHRPNLVGTAVFCGTETSYVRARAIPVGAADARRVGGQDYSSYTWLERPYKISGALTNAQIFYAILGRYRMYRRRGLTLRTSTEGDTLVRGNEMLITATARFGGQLERGACAAVTTTAPA